MPVHGRSATVSRTAQVDPLLSFSLATPTSALQRFRPFAKYVADRPLTAGPDRAFEQLGIGRAARALLQEPNAASVEVIHGADQLHVALRRAGLAFRRFVQLLNGPTHVGFDCHV